jgi:hypothetical protein
MRKSPLVLAAALLVATFSTSFAQTNGYIGVFGDVAGTQCCIQNTGAPATLYIIAVLGGLTSGGMSGAEFRVSYPTHNPVSQFLIVTPNPANAAALGNPMEDASDPNDDIPNGGGCNIAFPTAQGAMAGDHVLLYTLTLIGFTDLDMTVKSKVTPGNLNEGDCPLLTLFDPPNFTKVCLTKTNAELGEQAILFRSYLRTNTANCPSNGPICGPVAVRQETWSTMKELYRH